MVNDRLHIGVIQTSLHAEAAWVDDETGNWEQCVRMSEVEERRAKKEIRHYLASLRGVDRLPDIIYRAIACERRFPISPGGCGNRRQYRTMGGNRRCLAGRDR